MEWIRQLLDLVLHLDQHLNTLATELGAWLYAVLFAIVFCETGLVVMPFLPGDSLLFVVGALAATEGSPIDIVWVVLLLIVAAVLGDAVNYAIGRAVGPKVFAREDSRWLNKRHLVRTQEFYIKHGGKTIILARFVPIVRTFAPFVAGIGRMPYPRFFAFNVVGGIVWVVLFCVGGHLFGNLPSVKANFHYVVFGIIGISVLPIVYEALRHRSSARSAAQTADEPPA